MVLYSRNFNFNFSSLCELSSTQTATNLSGRCVDVPFLYVLRGGNINISELWGNHYNLQLHILDLVMCVRYVNAEILVFH